MIDTDIYCYSCGIAGRDSLAEHGPSQLMHRLQQQLPQYYAHTNLKCSSAHRGKDALPDMAILNQKLANLTASSISSGRRFITLSGDHSSAIGTWSGAFDAVHAQQQTAGLIWIDAHMDSHTFETSSTKNIHGMPLAVLLGHGDDQLTAIANNTPALQPNHVVLIGIRSYEPAEQALLDSLNVKIYYADEVNQRGLTPVIQETLDYLDQQVDHIGITIDIDAVDPEDAPGVSTPEQHGIAAHQLLEVMPLICKHPKWFGSEISEFLPHQDQHSKTEILAISLLEILLDTDNSHSKLPKQ